VRRLLQHDVTTCGCRFAAETAIDARGGTNPAALGMMAGGWHPLFLQRGGANGDSHSMTDATKDLDLGALLAEQDFIRRLVRSLIFHAADAEDVTQQTWLAALRHPLRCRGRARPFLASVARRVASNWNRSEGRRRRHEAQAAPAQPAPAVEEAFAREALRQQVVAELAALGEPYRSTLVLRFFEDLAPQAIAKRLQVPDATVRARLKRGLDALRARLDKRYGGDRAAWHAALMPLVEIGRGPTALPAGAAGAWSLAALWWSLAGLCALSGAALWLGRDRTPAEPVIASAPPAVLPADEPVVHLPATQRDPVPSPSLEDANPAGVATDAAPGNGLRGRLVLADGSPAPGRKVTVLGFDTARLFDGEAGASAASVPLAEAEAESDAEGRFVLHDLRPRALVLLHAGRGTSHSAFVPVPCSPGCGEVVDLGDIELEPRARVRGRVVDDEDRPVAGAEVWTANVPPLVALVANFDRFAPEHGGMLLLPSPQPEEPVAALVARTRSFLGGQLFQGEARSPAEAVVHVLDTPPWFERLWRALPLARTHTAADGTFCLDDVAPGVGMLVARHAGLASLIKPALKTAAGEERDVSTLTLHAGDTCRGRVVDHRGAPVADARVRVAAVPAAGFFGLAFCEAEVTTARDGTFAVGGLPAGRVLLGARAAGGRPWTVVGPVSASATTEVHLPAGAELTVAVSDAASVHVHLAYGPLVGELARMGLGRPVEGLAPRVTGKDTLVVRDLVPGCYLLAIGAPGRVTQYRLATVPGTVKAELREQAPPFEVVVLSSAGAPVPGARVRCRPCDADLAASVLPTYFGLPEPDVLEPTLGCTDARGRLRVSGLPGGPVLLWADHPAHGRATATVDLPAARAELQLPLAATLAGRLTDHGRPAARDRWRIAVVPEARSDGLASPYALAAPAADGSFRITGLGPGAHEVLVLPALPPRLDLKVATSLLQARVFAFYGADVERRRDVALREGETRHLAFDVDGALDAPAPPIRITGRVLVDGVPMPGLAVRTLSAVSSAIDVDLAAAVTTGADGAFAIDRAPEGTVDVVVEGAGSGLTGTLARRTVTVLPGANDAVVVAFSTCVVSGRVEVPAGRTVLRAEVVGSGPDGTRFTVPVHADGTFATGRIAAGRWRLEVASPELRGPEPAVVVDVEAGGRREGVVLAPDPAFVLTVRVADAAADTYVELSEPATGSVWVHQVGEDGSTRFTGLRAGTYHLGRMGAPRRAGDRIELAGAAEHEVRLDDRALTRLR